jgi:hypothetical protein
MGAQPLPRPECDLHLPFIEAQLYAVPRDPGETTAHWFSYRLHCSSHG